MYLELFDELRLNKKLIKLTNFEVAAYWAELQSILKQVVKKQTADERGFFTLDRDFMERETTLNIGKQLKCDEKLIAMGVVLKDPNDPNRIAISGGDLYDLKLKLLILSILSNSLLKDLNYCLSESTISSVYHTIYPALVSESELSILS